jgi:hypothetical protein
MKRRGFRPTTRTFQTLFKGLSRIQNWATHSKQLIKVYSLYGDFQKHIENLKRHEPDSDELSTRPLQSYIKILSDAGEYQKIFDVYFTLGQSGPLAPDQYFFTAMLQALAERPQSSRSEVGTQTASDAKLVWRDMLKASQRPPGFPLDSHVIGMAIKALSRGRSTDQDFALEIVRNYIGLAEPGETAKPALVPLATHTLDSALSLCNIMQKYTLCIHFAQQIMYSPNVSILDRHHMEHVLRAYGSLASHNSSVESRQALQTLRWMLKEELSGRIGPQIRPAANTYNLVLMVCCRSSDWPSATKTFELMTGYHTRDFSDSTAYESRVAPGMEKRSKGRNLTPDAETMSFMVRTALATRNWPNMRQSLRMVAHLSLDNLFGPLVKSAHGEGPPSRKEDKLAGFYLFKLASALIETADLVVDGRQQESGLSSEERSWQRLRSRAAVMLKRFKTSGTPSGTPDKRSKESPEMIRVGHANHQQHRDEGSSAPTATGSRSRSTTHPKSSISEMGSSFDTEIIQHT